MANLSPDLDKHVAALRKIHGEIKDLCASLSIDVEAINRFSETRTIALPWHDAMDPQLCLNRAREVLREVPRPANAEGEYELLRELGGKYFSQHIIGFIGALAIIHNDFWEPPTKAEFLEFFAFKQYLHCVDGSFEDRYSPTGLRGSVCWLVHDLLCIEALRRGGLSDECSSALEAIKNNLGIELFSYCAEQSMDEVSTKEISFYQEIERVLFDLARLKPETAPIVRDVLQVLQVCRDDRNSSSDGMFQISAAFRALFPEAVKPPNLSGTRIENEALRHVNEYSGALTLTNDLEKTLTGDAAWAAPIDAAAKEIQTKSAVRLEFKDADLVFSDKARKVLLEILMRVPGVEVIFTLDQFFTREIEGPLHKEVSEALNGFIKTENGTLLDLVVRDLKLDSVKEQWKQLLRDVCGVVGWKKVRVVSDEQLHDISLPDLACVITDSPSFRLPGNVNVFLKTREPGSSAINDLRGLLSHSPPPIIVAPWILKIVREFVVPTLGERNLPQDQNGLNGYRPEDILRCLSGKSFNNIGLIPDFEARENFWPDSRNLNHYGLTIQYNGQHEEPEVEEPEVGVPVDKEDPSLVSG
jgi:hypothetical protein